MSISIRQLKPSNKKQAGSKALPQPSLVLAGKWDVLEGPPSVDIESRVLTLPLGGRMEDRLIQRHELGHIRFSPEKRPVIEGVPSEVLNAVEDGRITSALVRCGLNMDGTLTAKTAKSVITQAKESPYLPVVAGLYIASLGDEGKPAKNLRKELLKLFPTETDRTILKALANQVCLAGVRAASRDVDTFSVTQEVARRIMELWGSSDTSSDDHIESSLDPLVTQLRYKTSETSWGDLEIVIHNMPVRVTRRRIERNTHISDMGSCLRRPERILTDKRCFGRIKRYQGGSLLIDVSGSMHPRREVLQRILDAAPALTVGLYAGEYAEGRLDVVAAQGRTVTKLPSPVGSGNIVDGPALRWLTAQSPPRIWVSDGYVTGIGDVPCHSLTIEALSICRQARIYRINSLEECLKLFTS